MKTILARSIVGFLLMILILPWIFSGLEKAVYEEHPNVTLEHPTLSHLLGTDNKGRDVLWRSLYGASLSLWMALIINGLGVFLGVLLGCFLFWIFRSSGMLIVENLLAIPFFVLGGIFSVLIGTSISSLLFSFSLMFALPYAYMTQSYIWNLQGAFFITRPSSIGRSFLDICLAHILPFLRGKIFYQFWISIHSTIFALASMTFLGFGLKPPLPEWGSLIYAALPYIHEQPFFMIAPFLLFIFLAWAIFQISTPPPRKRASQLYPPLQLSPLRCHYLVAHVENSKRLESSLQIENSPTSSWASFPEDYHQNYPDAFPIGIFVQDLLGKQFFLENKLLLQKMLETLKLPMDIWRFYPKELSGGMLQRLSLMIAKLTQSPLLLGAPLSSLNESMKSRAMEFLLTFPPLQTQLIYAPYFDIPAEYEKTLQPPLWLDHGEYKDYEEIQHFSLERQKKWNDSDILLTLNHPQTSYPLPSLEEQALTLYPREIVGMVGHSGIGKTTLGKLLVGFLPLSQGERKIKPGVFRSDMILQNPDQFDEDMQVWPLLKEFDLNRTLTQKDARILLTSIDLPSSLLTSPMKDLTKGEQYQILLLRSVVYQPHLLILDELLDHIEFSQYLKILRLLENLMAGDAQSCVVIISHKEPLLTKICDRIFSLQEKRTNLVK